jgi:hypothetical protein
MWFLLLFFFSLTPVQAQESPTPALFEQYKKDYLYQYDLYQQAYLKYIDKKQVYTKYGNITTQKEKFTASLDAINARNHVLKSYLTALRVKLDDYKSTNPTVTEKNQIEISKWEAWFEEQYTVILSINNEDDLLKWSKDFEQKYVTIQQTIYTALVQNEVNLHQSTLNLITQTAELIKNNPQIKPGSQQWLSSLTVKSDLVTTSLNKATSYTKPPSYQSDKFNNFYPESKIELTKSRNYLIEISSDLKLIVTKFLNS